MSDLLLSLIKKEPQWANRSRRSLQKSDCEQIALALKKERQKWFARNSSKLLSENEQFAWKKMYFSYVLDSFSPFLCQKSELLPSLRAQLLFFFTSQSLFRCFVLSITKNEWFARKTDDRISNPALSLVKGFRLMLLSLQALSSANSA